MVTLVGSYVSGWISTNGSQPILSGLAKQMAKIILMNRKMA